MRLFFINVPEVFQAASQILLILRYFVKQPILSRNIKFERDRTIGTPSSGGRKNTPKQRYASLVSTKSFLERPLIVIFSQKLAPRQFKTCLIDLSHLDQLKPILNSLKMRLKMVFSFCEIAKMTPPSIFLKLYQNVLLEILKILV